MASFRRHLHALCSAGLGRFGSEQTPVARMREVLARLRPRDPDIPLIRIGREFDGGYLVPVHLHPNNASPTRAAGPLRVPWSIEVTYLRRDRCPPVMPEARLPHPLDRDNLPGRPASILSADWGKGRISSAGG